MKKPGGFTGSRSIGAAVGALLFAVFATGCTGQLPGTFRFTQQHESFASTKEINTMIDILWVVDNSTSMDVAQQKLRDGAASFASKYLKPTWDIRTAVITTDLYLAHANYDSYTGGQIFAGNSNISSGPGTYIPTTFGPGGWGALESLLVSGLISADATKFVNPFLFRHLVPAWRPGAADVQSTGRFPAGAKYSQLYPGIHDGPIAGMCFESLPYFYHLNSNTRCQLRDAPSVPRDSASANSDCLTAVGSLSQSKCVNTVANDSVHSGRAIIDTKGASDTAALANDFRINLSVGTIGSGSERGIGSFLQFLQDNESGSTAFFRPGSVRAIIFISDEDDQTMETGSFPVGALATDPYVDSPQGLTSGDLWPNYSYTCPGRTIEGVSVPALSKCVSDSSLLLPASVAKQRMDRFFCLLDSQGSPACSSPNYFITTITPLTAASVNTLQADFDTLNNAIGHSLLVTSDRAQRYIDLGTLVGNGSSTGEITSADYSAILANIGNTVIQKRGTFTLTRAPLSSEDTLVIVYHADGREPTTLTPDQWTISDNKLIVTDIENVLLQLTYTDTIFVDYQPKTQY